MVAKNAIKHGIFTKDLIVSSEIESKSVDEYQTLLNNLIENLSPCNQLESLLVQKVATDFWRLRRTLRYESGSIARTIQSLLKEVYSYHRSSNDKIDKDIEKNQKIITWNTSFLEALAKRGVQFDKPKWKNNDIESDIADDFYLLAKSLNTLSKAEKEWLYQTYDLTFEEPKQLLDKHGYSDPETLSSKLTELYTAQNKSLTEEIHTLTKQKQDNNQSNKLLYMLGMIPSDDNSGKVLKYERSLQKSIYQNLIMLKKLQGIF